MKKLIVLLILSISFSTLFSQTTFSGLDINLENSLLFSSETVSMSGKTHKNLYTAELNLSQKELKINSPQLITCYPEKIEVLKSGSLIQIRNSEGIAKYSLEDDTLLWDEGFPVFPGTETDKTLITPTTSISPDGNWVCYYEKTSAAKANVVLKNINTNKSIVLATNAEYRFDSVPVAWNSNSKYLIYEKDANLYFLAVDEALSATFLQEDFRKIGKGTIASVFWANEKLLVYIDNDMVYKIYTNELYTRALYSDLVGTGKISGRLSYSFDNQKDMFWTNSDGDSIVIVQDHRTLLFMELSGTEKKLATTLFSYPFANIPAGAINFTVFWSDKQKGEELPYVWVELIRSGKTESYLYKLHKDTKLNNTSFENLPLPPNVSKPTISPDTRSIAFMDEKSVHVYDIQLWRQTAVYTKQNIVTFEWVDRNGMFIGGKETVLYWEPYTDAQKHLFLSSALNYAWDGQTNKIIMQTSNGNFQYLKERNVWEPTLTAISRKATIQNPFFRVFLGESKNTSYTNAIFVRMLTGLSETRPLLSIFETKKATKPKVALVFDAFNNADGIVPILSVLSDFNIRSTFFINGEFIRRFPSYVNELVASGHHCASMFFTTADLTSSSFIVDESFIRRGLARNEDEFYALTGEELTLYWHAPYYRITEAILSGSQKAGYTYVKPTVKQLDLSTLENTARTGGNYYSSARIIEAVNSVLKDGAIIPISVGLSNGSRSDYLYDRVNVLVSAILEAGYEIVPISDIL